MPCGPRLKEKPITVSAPRAANAGLVLATACLCQLLVVLDGSVVNVALAPIARSLHFDAGDLSWVINAYTLPYGGLLLLGGRLADLLGHRVVMLAALVLFGLTSVLAGCAGSSAQLILARGGHGIAAALLAPVTLTVIMTTFPEGAPRQRAIAVWASVAALGSALGVVLSGVLVQWLNWRWIFFINVPFVLAGCALALTSIPPREATARRRSVDALGAVLITCATTLLTFAAARAGNVGWASISTAGSIAGAVVLGLAFLAWESRGASTPLVTRSAIRPRPVWVAAVIVAFVGAATIAGFYFASLFLQNVLHYSPVRTGLAFLPFCVGVILGTVVTPRLVVGMGLRRWLSVSLVLGGIGMLGFARLGAGSSGLAFVIAALVTSFGVGGGLVATMALGTSGVPPEQAGLVSGVLNTCRQLGGSLALAALVSLAASIGRTSQPGSPSRQLADGYHAAFLVSAVTIILAGLFAALSLRHSAELRS